MTLRAVVFDFDGVIANSEPLHYRGFRDVLAGEGIALTERDYYGRYLGFDDEGAFAAVAGDRGIVWSGPQIGALIRKKAKRLEELEREASVLFPGAAEAIRRLAAVYPLAIASGALREEIARVLAREGLERYFRAIVAAGDTGAGKPAPDPYAKAVTLLAGALGGPMAASSCVAVEDSRWGLESARAAGLLTVGITHTYPAAELQPADAIVSSLEALTPDFLTTLSPRVL